MKISNASFYSFSMLIASLALACLASNAPAQAGASRLSLSLDQAIVTAMPGQTLLFTGVLQNLPTDTEGVGETLTLASDTIPPPSSTDITVDDSPYNGAPGEPGYDYFFGTSETLAPNATISDLPLFNVDVLANATVGEIVTGTFTADYSDSRGNALTDPVNFIIDVVPLPTREPSGLATMLLAAFGLGLMMMRGVWRSRRWFRSALAENPNPMRVQST